jgi:hypothetical protein
MQGILRAVKTLCMILSLLWYKQVHLSKYVEDTTRMSPNVSSELQVITVCQFSSPQIEVCMEDVDSWGLGEL